MTHSATPCAKVTYTSKVDALAASKSILKAHRANKLVAYLCQHCGKWHLSHQKPKGKPKAGREGKTSAQEVTRYKAR